MVLKDMLLVGHACCEVKFMEYSSCDKRNQKCDVVLQASIRKVNDPRFYGYAVFVRSMRRGSFV